MRPRDPNARTRRFAPPRRRGVALLLAMAALVTMMLLVTTIVRVASNASLIERRDSFTREAGELADKLAEQLPELLPPLAPPPRTDPWMNIVDTRAGELLIRARGIDLSGRLHVRHLDKMARFGLPGSLQNVICEAAERDGPVLLEEIELDDEFIPIFPPPLPPPDPSELQDMEFDEFGEPLYDEARDLEAAPQEPDESEDLIEEDPLDELVLKRTVLCEWMSTVGPGELNVNTCPLDLLRAALGEGDLTAGQECLALREEGKPVTDQIVARLNVTQQLPQQSESGTPARPGASARPAAPGVDENQLRFTNRSQALGVLIELQRGRQTCRWWVTMEYTRRGWQLVEKRRIYP